MRPSCCAPPGCLRLLPVSTWPFILHVEQVSHLQRELIHRQPSTAVSLGGGEYGLFLHHHLDLPL